MNGDALDALRRCMREHVAANFDERVQTRRVAELTERV